MKGKTIWDICDYPCKENCNPEWCGTEVCQKFFPKRPNDNKMRYLPREEWKRNIYSGPRVKRM